MSTSSRISRIIAGSTTVATLGYAIYYGYGMKDKYTANVEKLSGQKREYLSKPNFDLYYSPLVFFYLYGYDNTKESLKEYYERLEFFKPKLIGFNLEDSLYYKTYQKDVKAQDFRKDMKKAVHHLKAGNFDELEKMGKSYEDLIYLLTFNYCYSGKCRVVFVNEEEINKKKSDHLDKIQEIKKNASSAVKKLMELDVVDKRPVDKNIESLVDQIIKQLDVKSSVFTEPIKRTYFCVVKEKDQNEVAEAWKSKMKLLYDIDVLNAKDESISEATEKKQLEKISHRMNQ